MIRASTPCGPQHELLPFKHGLARVPALITDADLTVFCGVKRKSCAVRHKTKGWPDSKLINECGAEGTLRHRGEGMGASGPRVSGVD
jgi:hypothetical protein